MHIDSYSDSQFALAADIIVERYANGVLEEGQDFVAEEIPVALEYNGISVVVMMATPADLRDFAYGYSLTEGVIDSVSDIFDCEIFSVKEGIQVALTISNRCFARLKSYRRAMAGRSGCGICGLENLELVRRQLKPLKNRRSFNLELITKACVGLKEDQMLFNKTGATHAASWINLNGSIECVREDVGRHNAVDKLVGTLSLSEIDFAQGALLTTSRASFEIVQKAASVGIGHIVAMSAPTAMAIRLARELNVSLTGFMRHGRYVNYSRKVRWPNRRTGVS